MLIMFHDMITGMKSNTKLRSTVTELFLRKTELNISLAFILQLYFKLSKTVRPNTTSYFVMKCPNIRELQQIASNNSSDIL